MMILSAGLALLALAATAKAVPVAVVPDTRSFTMLDDLSKALWPERHPVFAATTADERDAIKDLLPRMLAAARGARTADPVWKPLAARASMRVETWTHSGETFFALIEEDSKRHGSGAYVIRAGKKEENEVLLEAPHVFFDLGTEVIATQIFFDPPAGVPRPRALFTNTIHRYQDSKEKSARRSNPADVCHNADHLFQTATLVTAEAMGDARVIQLHGFADATVDEEGKRPPEGATMVVSGGRKDRATALAKSISKGLVRDVDRGVKLYPDESKALGATTNVQGIALQSLEHAEFLHLEMSKSLRDALASDPERIHALARAVLAPARD